MGAWKRLFARAKLLSLTLFQAPVISRERLGLAVALGVAQAGWWSGPIDLENFLMLSFISFLWLFIRGILRDRFLFTRYCQSSGCYTFCIFFSSSGSLWELQNYLHRMNFKKDKVPVLACSLPTVIGFIPLKSKAL